MNFDLKNIHKLRTTKIVLISFIAVICVLTVFQAGVFVGYRKASFSYSLGDRYYKAFDRKDHKGGPNPFNDKELFGANGAVGTILRVSLPTIVVSNPDNTEKIIRINNDTLIRQFRDTASTSDLKIGEHVIVIGNPNDQAEINAKLIRLLPPPPDDGSSPVMGTSTNF